MRGSSVGKAATEGPWTCRVPLVNLLVRDILEEVLGFILRRSETCAAAAGAMTVPTPQCDEAFSLPCLRSGCANCPG